MLHIGTPTPCVGNCASGVGFEIIGGIFLRSLFYWPSKQANFWRDIITKVLSPPKADQILDLITSSLDSDKAENILTIPLQGKSSMADYMVIASGASSRQVAAMAEHVEFKLKQAGVSLLGLEGMRQADWVLLDANDVIVHLFRPEVRDFYGLERMWMDASDEEVVTVGRE